MEFGGSVSLPPSNWIDPGDVLPAHRRAKRPVIAACVRPVTAGAEPPLLLTVHALDHSERGCGMPASRARTSVSRYRRWPPRVRMDVSLPAFAHRVTVLGSTRNIVATSAGVSRGSASGVRADMCTASPPGPVLRSCVVAFLAPGGALPWMSYMAH